MKGRNDKYHKGLTSLLYVLILVLQEADTKTWLIIQNMYWGKVLWRKKEELEESLQTMIQVRILWSRGEGRRIGKESGCCSYKKFFANWWRVLETKSPRNPSDNQPALKPLPCLATRWEQPVGSVAQALGSIQKDKIWAVSQLCNRRWEGHIVMAAIIYRVLTNQ